MRVTHEGNNPNGNAAMYIDSNGMHFPCTTAILNGGSITLKRLVNGLSINLSPFKRMIVTGISNLIIDYANTASSTGTIKFIRASDRVYIGSTKNIVFGAGSNRENIIDVSDINEQVFVEFTITTQYYSYRTTFTGSTTLNKIDFLTD